MKVTEILLQPDNKPENRVIEYATMEGDHNIITFALDAYKAKLERRKTNYIFRVEDAPANFYYYFFTNTQDFEKAKRLIPNLTKTWRKGEEITKAILDTIKVITDEYKTETV